MTGSAAEIGWVERTAGLVEAQHARLVEYASGNAHEIVTMLLERRIVLKHAIGHAVRERVVAHAHVHVRVGEPLDRLGHVRHAAETHLGVEIVRQAVLELTLDGSLPRQQAQIVR